MSDIIGDAMTWLNGQLKTKAAKQLTYRRGDDTLTIAMTIGGKPNPLFSVLSSQPGAIDALLDNPVNAIRSFVFDSADLDFGDGPVDPDDGDKVLETINGTLCVFTLTPPATGQLPWEYVGQRRGPGSRIVVHTQFTGTE